MVPPVISPRAQEMKTLYSSGQTLEQIGAHYGITREGVRQILKKIGVSRADGGHVVLLKKKRQKEYRRRDAKSRACYGCSYQQLRRVQKIVQDMQDNGTSRCRTPLNAFRLQRTNARRRGIRWEFCFWDWWQIWQRSGRWSNRGRRRGQYVMARFGDEGPYAVDNVEIILSVDNLLQGQARKQPSTRGHLLYSDHSQDFI